MMHSNLHRAENAEGIAIRYVPLNKMQRMHCLILRFGLPA